MNDKILWMKWALAIGAVFFILSIVGNCSVAERQEAREIEKHEEKQGTTHERDRPAIGDWKTDVFKGNGGR